MNHPHIEMGQIEGNMDLESEDATLARRAEALQQARQASLRDKGCMEMVARSIKVMVFSTKLNFLLPFGAAALLVRKFLHNQGLVFIFSMLGIIPLAERLGFVTEQLSFFTGPTFGGLINATFGNATELIISVHALKTGMIRVVQQSLLGSILSNLLLVLGCAFLCGGLVFFGKNQSFDKSAAIVNSGLLMMAVMGILFPAVLHYTRTETHVGPSELGLSRFISCVMLVAYVSYLVYQLKNERRAYNQMAEQSEPNTEDVKVPKISKWAAIIWLAILTMCISILSDHLVDAIEGASASYELPIAFISVILLPIVGNAAEHASAIMFAIRDKLDISLGVAIGSSTQISMFGIPFCVVAGWIMGYPMDLNFHIFETVTLFMTVLVASFLLQEGTSNYFKGLILILCYLIVAAGFYVHTDASTEGIEE